MKQKTILQNLKYTSGLTVQEFADKVGVNFNTLSSQLSKKVTSNHAIKYAQILGIDFLQGYECGAYVEIKIKSDIND